ASPNISAERRILVATVGQQSTSGTSITSASLSLSLSLSLLSLVRRFLPGVPGLSRPRSRRAEPPLPDLSILEP
ncbi:MAG: hypothetical protein L3J72_04410, partial [Thermoplasmata archaeon]|nr:hypothetical protein [Thermoplasmata archaeon]